MSNIARAQGPEYFIMLPFAGSKKSPDSQKTHNNNVNKGFNFTSLNPFSKNEEVKAMNQHGDVLVKSVEEKAKQSKQSQSFIGWIYSNPEHYLY